MYSLALKGKTSPKLLTSHSVDYNTIIAWSFNPHGIDTLLHCGILLDTIRYTCRDLGFAKSDQHSPSQQKEEAAISPIPTEEEKKKKEPAAYMPKPPYPQRLKAENKNKAPKKEPKEEKGATNDSVKFQ
ncbi:hypothetical protein PIB30_082874 [Stylosanthes scabra]|uniref:Uncharacterized protein n=1 Tax=Stylosanthes scabra TaxID=79078 RepID=A0ABU6TRK8_9FABA|nr:hypothetical protein [Stylosanthes scabra]